MKKKNNISFFKYILVEININIKLDDKNNNGIIFYDSLEFISTIFML